MNLHDPVRVASHVNPGTATVTLSFNAWEGARVAPTTHSVNVLPAKPGPKSEPTSPSLIASLSHPERKSTMINLEFSPDGARVFGLGHPSGIIQIWDVASSKEVQRIDSRPARRGSVQTLLAPDWKTLFITVQKETAKTIERDGKRSYRFEQSGDIRVWDLDSGKEKDPLRPAAGSAPMYSRLAPGGRFLLCLERPTSEPSDTQNKDVTVVWDLETRKKSKLDDGNAVASCLPDGKNVVITLHDYNSKTSTVKLLDIATRNELAKINCPRYSSVSAVAPDGSVVAVHISATKSAPPEIWFLDALTLEDRGKLVGKGDPERSWYNSGLFTPDGKRFITLDGEGNVVVWLVAVRKVERTLRYGGNQIAWQMALRPDGKMLAVGWAPKAEEDVAEVLEPDPQDLPQPRVSLIDLAGSAPPRVLIAPHGHVGPLAFSPDGRTLAFGSTGAVHLFNVTK